MELPGYASFLLSNAWKKSILVSSDVSIASLGTDEGVDV